MNDASPRLTERGRQRRRAMLDAATQAFLEHGFEGTTLDMVIERAGGSRGTLYSSFGGKEGLLRESEINQKGKARKLWDIEEGKGI